MCETKDIFERIGPLRRDFRGTELTMMVEDRAEDDGNRFQDSSVILAMTKSLWKREMCVRRDEVEKKLNGSTHTGKLTPSAARSKGAEPDAIKKLSNPRIERISLISVGADIARAFSFHGQ